MKDPRGYIYPLLEEIKPFRNKILLQNNVKEIRRVANKKYEVFTSNGTKYIAKHVLVTFSSGVLQSDYVKFNPKLPAWKIEALNMVPMNHYCKIFFLFKKKFWDNAGYVMFATKFNGEYLHWQNFEIPGLYSGKPVLQVVLVGDLCYENHFYTDNEIKTEVTKILKKVYVNATAPIRK